MLNPIRYGGGPGRPGSQENRCGSLEVGPKLLKFLDFVPFNLLKVLIKKNFGFFLKILRNWTSKTTSHPRFWVKNKKFQFLSIFSTQIILFLPEFEFYMFSAFFWGILHFCSSKIENCWILLYANDVADLCTVVFWGSIIGLEISAQYHSFMILKLEKWMNSED